MLSGKEFHHIEDIKIFHFKQQLYLVDKSTFLKKNYVSTQQSTTYNIYSVQEVNLETLGSFWQETKGKIKDNESRTSRCIQVRKRQFDPKGKKFFYLFWITGKEVKQEPHNWVYSWDKEVLNSNLNFSRHQGF